MTVSVRARVLAGFGVAIALVAVLGGIADRSATATLEEIASVRSSRAELDATRETMQQVGALVGGVRGFVITGRETFLAPHDSAARILPPLLARLRALVADEPDARRLVDTAAALVRRRIAFDDTTIALRRAGGASAAAALVGTGRGSALMDRIAFVTSALEARISVERARRTDRLEALATRTRLGVVVASVLAILAVGAGIASIFHGLASLERATSQVRVLSGLLPICSGCKKIRDDRGYWNQIESYISRHSEAEFSHGLCPDCWARLYPDMGPYPSQ